MAEIAQGQQDQQQNQQNEEIKQETIDGFRKEIQRQLLVLFNKTNFLSSKYFITKCLNENLDIHLSVLASHARVQRLLHYQPMYQGENQAELSRTNIFLEEINKCEFIRFNRQTQILSPKFQRERNSIYVNKVSSVQIEEFTKFIKTWDQYESKTVEVPAKEGEEKTEQIEENLTVQESSDGKAIELVGKTEEVAKNVYQWLFKRKFNDIVLDDLVMSEYNYYYHAYFKFYGQKPKQFKTLQPQVFQPMMMPQMFDQYPQQQYYNNQFQGRNAPYNRNFNNNNNNNNRNNYNNNNNNPRQYNNLSNNYNNQNRPYNNNNRQQQNGRQQQGGVNQNNFNNRRQYNNNNNYNNRGNNGNYNQNRNNQRKADVNFEDDAQFPDLGGNPQDNQVQPEQQQQQLQAQDNKE